MNSLWIELNHNRLFFFIPWSLSLSLMMIAEFAFGLNRSMSGERCPLPVECYCFEFRFEVLGLWVNLAWIPDLFPVFFYVLNIV